MSVVCVWVVFSIHRINMFVSEAIDEGMDTDVESIVFHTSVTAAAVANISVQC